MSYLSCGNSLCYCKFAKFFSQLQNSVKQCQSMPITLSNRVLSSGAPTPLGQPVRIPFDIYIYIYICVCVCVCMYVCGCIYRVFTKEWCGFKS